MLIFKEEYTIAIPIFQETDMHCHTMLHIILSENPMYLLAEGKEYTNCNIAFIAGNIRHKVETKTTESLVLLIDTSTALAEGIRHQWLSDGNIYVMNKPLQLLLSEKTEEQITSFVEHFLAELKIVRMDHATEGKRMLLVIENIQSGKLLDKTIPEIASFYAFSISRLEHLFKQETGMRLKNYLLMNKLKLAYQMVAEGKSITEAAMVAGFSDSAHLAATAKKMTGISISTFFNRPK
jgi:AraC-like DNA-binding protein